MSLRDFLIIFVRKYLFFSLFILISSLGCCILQQPRFVGHRLNRAHEAYILRHHRGQYGGDFFLMVWICELLFLRRI